VRHLRGSAALIARRRATAGETGSLRRRIDLREETPITSVSRPRADRTRLLALAVVALCASALFARLDGPPYAFLAGLCLGVALTVACGSLLVPGGAGPPDG